MNPLKTTIIGQYIYSTITRVTTIGLKAFLAVFLVHQLSSHEYGFYGVIVATLGIWISVSDLGWGDFLRREIPALNAQARTQYYQNSNLVQLGWMSLLLSSFLIFVPAGKISSILQFNISNDFLIIFCFLMALAGLFPLAQIYLNYSKKIKEFNNMSTLQILIWIFLMFGILVLPGEIITVDTVLQTWGFSFLIILAWFLLKFRIQPFAFPSKKFIKDSLYYGFPLCFADIGKKIWQYYDRYLIGTITSLSVLAPYHFFNTLFDASERFNQITIVPYIFEAHDQREINKRNRLLMSIIKTRIAFQCAAIIGLILLFSTASNLIPTAYSSQINLFCAVGIASVVRIPSQTFYVILLLERKSRITAISNFIGLGVSLMLNFYLIPKYQALGAAYAMIVSTLAVTIFQICFIDAKKYIDLPYLLSFQMEKDILNYWKRKWPIRRKKG